MKRNKREGIGNITFCNLYSKRIWKKGLVLFKHLISHYKYLQVSSKFFDMCDQGRAGYLSSRLHNQMSLSFRQTFHLR